MAKNHIWRIGLDASGFSRGAKQAGRDAESMSQQIKRSLDLGSLKGRVSDIIDTGQIKSVTDATVAQARAQLEDLTAYKKQLEKAGVPDTDATYGRVSDAIQELTYDIREYMVNLTSVQDAERSEQQSSQESTQQVEQHAQAYRTVHREAQRAGPSLRDMAGGFRRLVSSGLAVRLVSSLFGRLRSIVSSYVSQNAALQAQVNGLKTAMGQALAPAINIVVNAMSALMPIVVSVSNAIGSLIGLLGGKWASAASGAKKYANAVGGAGSAQKNLNRQLLSFDEINKLSSNDTGGGGGGSSGSGSLGAKIEAAAPAWLERFRSKFSSLFSSEEFSAANIGGKLGMSIQAGLEWLGSEATNFDWRSAGAKLRQNWDEFWATVSPETFARSLGQVLGGMLDFVVGALKLDTSWSEIKRRYNEEGGLSALEFIGGIANKLNPLNIVQDLLSTVPDLFDGIGDYFSKQGELSAQNFFAGFAGFLRDPGKWMYDHVVAPMQSSVVEKFAGLGSDSSDGYFDGIEKKSVSVQIEEKFGRPLVNAVKNFLGIHSPSTVFAGFGQNCVDGFLNKFTDLKGKITEKLDSFKSMISETAEKIKNAFNFNWEIPSLKLPHLSVTWEPVSGILARILGSASLPHLSVKWFARGAVLDGAQIFGAAGNTLLGGGEAGREAVLPLDRNTGWMDELAQRLYVLITNTAGSSEETIRVPVSLDGELLTEVVARRLRNRQRATGTAF